MKIKYLKEDDLNAVKSNLPGIFREVVKEPHKNLNQFFEREDILKDTPYEIKEFKLDMSQPKGKESLTDTENVQRVYNHMKFLSDSQASDERIWAAYTFSEFIDYMRYRWEASSVSDLENRYLFGYSIQRSLFRNGVARLWWIGRFTYDETRTDPYELTKFLCKEQDYIENICGRNIFNNPDVGIATISALYDAEMAGLKINRDVVREISKYVNLLAGTYLLDSLSKEEIYNKICAKLGFNVL
jgi:hypothetical protein